MTTTTQNNSNQELQIQKEMGRLYSGDINERLLGSALWSHYESIRPNNKKLANFFNSSVETASLKWIPDAEFNQLSNSNENLHMCEIEWYILKNDVGCNTVLKIVAIKTISGINYYISATDYLTALDTLRFNSLKFQRNILHRA